MIIQHWILLIGCWEYPDRSFTKASKTIRRHAMNLAVAFAKDSMERLTEALGIIKQSLSSGCKIYKRKSEPNAFNFIMRNDNPKPVLDT
jgi:hypothetical protein